MTILYDAVMKADLAQVTACIEEGVDVNEPVVTADGYNYALNLAASQGLTEIADLLLAHGAWVNMRDAAGHTPIEYAEEYEYSELVKLLQTYAQQTCPPKEDTELERTFYTAITTGDLSSFQHLYASVAETEETMLKASELLVKRICQEQSAETYQNTWLPMINTCADNPHFLTYLYYDQYRYGFNPEEAWWNISTIARLYANNCWELIDLMLAQIDDIHVYPAMVCDNHVINCLAMAIMLYSNPQQLDFIRKLIEAYEFPSLFTQQPANACIVSIYRDEDFAQITSLNPFSKKRDLCNTLIKEDNALALAITINRSNTKELIAYLADHVSDHALVLATAHHLNQKNITCRLWFTKPSAAGPIKIYMDKSSCDAACLSTSQVQAAAFANTSVHSEPSPRPNFMFYFMNGLACAEDHKGYAVAEILLDKLHQRFCAHEKSDMLHKFFAEFITQSTATDHTPADKLDYLLAAQMMLMMIPKPSLNDIEKMLQSFLYKIKVLKQLFSTKNHPQIQVQYNMASEYLNASLNEYNQTDRINFKQNSKIYQKMACYMPSTDNLTLPATLATKTSANPAVVGTAAIDMAAMRPTEEMSSPFPPPNKKTTLSLFRNLNKKSTHPDATIHPEREEQSESSELDAREPTPLEKKASLTPNLK